MQFRKLSGAVLPAMAETVNPLHTLTRGIFTKKKTTISDKGKHVLCYQLSLGTLRCTVLYL